MKFKPLIAGTLTGLIIGGTLEMIALGWINIGAAMAPDAAVASIISTTLVYPQVDKVLLQVLR